MAYPSRRGAVSGENGKRGLLGIIKRDESPPEFRNTSSETKSRPPCGAACFFAVQFFRKRSQISNHRISPGARSSEKAVPSPRYTVVV